MSERPPVPDCFAGPTLDQLTGLVFELASQLHVERAHRIALEAALEQAGVLAPDAAERAATAEATRVRAAAALDRAMAGLTRVMTESPDRRAPLRVPVD